MPKIRVHFYKPVISGGRKLAALLDEIHGIPPDKRILAGADSYQRGVLDLVRSGGKFIGTASQIRMLGLPNKTNLDTGRREIINLKNREGLGEEMEFVHDPDMDVIAIQSSRFLGAGGVGDLLGGLTGDAVDFYPIIREDALEAFRKMKAVKKIRLRVARPQVRDDQPTPAITSLLKEMQDFEAMEAEVILSVGRHRKHALDRNLVTQVIDKALGYSDLRGLEVAGRDDLDSEEKTKVIDFVKWLLEYEDEVDYDGRRLNRDQCRKLVGRALREYAPYLKAYHL